MNAQWVIIRLWLLYYLGPAQQNACESTLAHDLCPGSIINPLNYERKKLLTKEMDLISPVLAQEHVHAVKHSRLQPRAHTQNN